MEESLISRRESSRHFIPCVLIQIEIWYLGKYICIIDNEWSKSWKGNNIGNGIYIYIFIYLFIFIFIRCRKIVPEKSLKAL